jgi:tetratricopeptide (TPR) repeat protein
VRIPFVLGLVFLLVSPIPWACAQNGESDKKQLEAQAKQLITEGQALEQQGKLPEALDKYVDAEGVFSTREGLASIRRTREVENQKVNALVAATHHTYDEAKFGDCAAQLEEGLNIEPANPLVHYDLAACYAKLEDRGRAFDHLDQSFGGVMRPKWRAEELELRSELLMGTNPAGSLANAPPEATKRLENFNEAYLAADRDPGDITTNVDKRDPVTSQNLCELAKDLEHDFRTNAAAEFNQAKCAEEDGRPDEAARLLGEYMKLAPKAMDQADVEVRREQLTSLSSIPGDPGRTVGQHYALAARYLDYRRYDRAIAEYQAAEQALPSYPQTQWKLALLYESFGDVAMARERFQRYQQLEPNAEGKDKASVHLNSLEGRRALYDAAVDEAEGVVSELLLRSMGISSEGVKHKAKLTRRQQRWASRRYKRTLSASEKLSTPYVIRQLDRARGILEGATALFPLGVEANELLALVYLEANDWPAALSSFDAPAARNLPVSFYAQVSSAHSGGEVRAAKVEIGSNTVRLVYLSSYNTSKHVAGPPKSPAGDDDLGNLVVSASDDVDAEAEALTVGVADLKAVETKNNFVDLKLSNDDLYLSPVYMLAAAPFEGRASRSFGNEYTRLFIRYLGYEDAKLGAEGMTPGDKFKLGLAVALAGRHYYKTARSLYRAYENSARVTQLLHLLSKVSHNPRCDAKCEARVAELVHLLHLLSIAQTASLGVKGVKLYETTEEMVQDIQVDTAALLQTSADQRQILEGLDFKIIPSRPLEFEYREKL